MNTNGQPHSERANRRPEDRRTWAGWFPDAEARSDAHYSWAHKFLPMYLLGRKHPFDRLVETMPDMTVWLQARWDTMFMEAIEGRTRDITDPTVPFRTVSDLKVDVAPLNAGRCLLITMPPVERSPNAYFAGLVFGNSPSRYFTLEASSNHAEAEKVIAAGGDAAAVAGALRNATLDPGKGILCEWIVEPVKHLNSGWGLPINAAAFLAGIDAYIKKRWWKMW